MNQIFLKLGAVVANLALLVTVLNVNLTCFFFIHQPELPDGAERFKKF